MARDTVIIDEARDSWWLVVGTTAMAPFVGIFEGLAISRHYFKVLFFSVFCGVGGVYLPLLIYNGTGPHVLTYIWAGIIGLEVIRGAPVIFSVLWALRDDPLNDEAGPAAEIVSEERGALLSSAPSLSINGGDDEYIAASDEVSGHA